VTGGQQEGPFLLRLRQLEEGENRIDLSAWGAQLGLQPGQIVLDGRVRLDATAHRTGDKVNIRGEITARTEMPCDRCLDPVGHEIRATLRVFAERKESRDRRSDQELREEDTGIVYHDGLSLDLTDEVRQLLLLELPWHFVCSGDCLGLCPVCGCNRNREKCDCRTFRGDPRWDALREDQT